MNGRWIRATACIGLVAIGTSGCATYRTHPEFKARQKTLQTVTCLPPDVEVFKVAFTGTHETMPELYPAIKEQTVDALRHVMEAKGYQWQPLDVSEPALEQTPDLRTTYHTIQQIYAKTLEDIKKRRQKKFTYTIGAEINPMADYAQADALFLVKWLAYKKTGGEIAKDIAKSILIAAVTLGSVVAFSPTSEAMAHVALIDGNTGDVLWYHVNFQDTAVDVAEEWQLTRALNRLLKPFPKSAAKVLAEKERRARRRHHAPEPVGVSPVEPEPSAELEPVAAPPPAPY